MQTRNLKYSSATTVDMEINHPTYGWIPFTANPNDPEQLGRDLYAQAIAGTLGVIAAYIAPPPDTSPKPDAFAQAVKTGLGGILVANQLMTLYPAFFPAIQTQNWADLQTLILDAKAKAVITLVQYTAIKTAAGAFNIPVVLP